MHVVFMIGCSLHANSNYNYDYDGEWKDNDGDGEMGPATGTSASAAAATCRKRCDDEEDCQYCSGTSNDAIRTPVLLHQSCSEQTMVNCPALLGRCLVLRCQVSALRTLSAAGVPHQD